MSGCRAGVGPSAFLLCGVDVVSGLRLTRAISRGLAFPPPTWRLTLTVVRDVLARMCHRPLGQLTLQHGEQVVTELWQRCRALRGQGSGPVLRPSLASTLYRPDADPQVVSDDRVLVALPEPPGRRHPQLLAEDSPFVGQPASLRIPHARGVPQGSWTVSPADTTLRRSVSRLHRGRSAFPGLDGTASARAPGTPSPPRSTGRSSSSPRQDRGPPARPSPRRSGYARPAASPSSPGQRSTSGHAAAGRPPRHAAVAPGT